MHRQGMLARLVVDWYAPQSAAGRALVSLFGGEHVASALAAHCDELPRDLVWSFPARSVFWKWHGQRLAARGRIHEAYLETDAAFARALGRMKLPPHDVFFGYSYAALEALEAEKDCGCLILLDQIDPGPAHFRLVAEEMMRHPELAGLPAAFPAAYYGRVQREWELADVIVVNSEWSRDAIVSEGADAAKIEVLPLAYETEHGARSKESGMLRVLWLGQVNVGKGIHYLLQAARLLQQEPVEFLIAGPLGVRREIVGSAPKNVRWLAPVPRNQATKLYQECDVFVLPTLSDGFAITQLEAFAHGLPVITTPNCGRVVEDRVTGFIIPPRDPKALAEAIMNFVRHPELAGEMSPHCIEASKSFSVDAYGIRLVGIIEKHMACRRTESQRSAASSP
jgi:hypothetical protein